MNNYIINRPRCIKGFVFVLGLILLFLTGCTAEESEADSLGEKLEAKVETVDSEEAERVETTAIDDFYGYWTNEDYSYYLDAERLFVFNQTTEDFYRYVIQGQEVEENHLDLELEGQVTLQLTLEADEIEISGNDQLLYTESKFARTTIEQLNMSFLVYMAKDGESANDQRDLTIEDFKGYWAPFNSSHSPIALPFGDFAYYIGNNSHLIGYFGGEGHDWYIQDYEINGNTMTVWKESVDYYAVDAFNRGELDHIEMELTETKMTLFEEEGRDRLVFHENGNVLLRLPEEELATTSILNQPTENNLFYTDFDIHATSFIETLAGMPEEDYTIHRKVDIDSSIQIENYPYSLGDLSEEDLYKEHLILNEFIPHPEGALAEDIGINQLISKNYEATSSFASFKDIDTGYYFSPQLLMSQGAVGSFEHKSGVRKDAESLLKTYEVSSATFENHIYTLLIKEAGTADLSEKYFYRINEDVIYEMDENGEFLRRYENGADWKNFEGLPERGL